APTPNSAAAETKRPRWPSISSRRTAQKSGPQMSERPRISGKDAANIAFEARTRGPVRLEASGDPESGSVVALGAPPTALEMGAGERKPPPRIRKPSAGNDRCLAPTPDLEGHRARLR